jgi:hypothetical protein
MFLNPWQLISTIIDSLAGVGEESSDNEFVWKHDVAVCGSHDPSRVELRAVPTPSIEDFWKGGSEPMTISEKTLCSVGRKWVYIFDWRKPKKLIPIDYLRNSKVAARNFLTRPKTTL